MQTDKIKYVVIGGSAGSFQVISRILRSLPENYNKSVIMCLHRLKHLRSGFVEALETKSQLKIEEPFDKEHIKPGKVYLAPANYHLSIELGNNFSLSTEGPVNHSRPSIDITFDTAAYVFKQKMVGVLLSGANKDGAYGIKRIKESGGTTIVQDPAECQAKTMTSAALNLTKVDYVMSADQIISFLLKLNN
jgi:two-component system chemotaxis response regulator CheB